MNVRPPHRDELPEVLALMRAHDSAAWGDSDWTEGELVEHWDGLDLSRDAWVAEVDGGVVGYVDFELRGSGRMLADGYVDPAWRGTGVGSALLAAIETRAGEELAHVDRRAYLQYGALVDGGATAAFFEQHGFRDVRRQWRMVIDLDEAPEVESPPGIEIRPYRPGEERVIHAAMEEAWSVGGWLHEPRSYEDYATLTFARSAHDPSLYLVAAEGDDIAGAILCDWKRNGDWGWVGTLGVRPKWRKRGIGEALLRTGFGEFFRRGERTVALQVDAQSSTGAPRLYERAGMRVLYRIAVFEKELRAT